MTTVTFQGRTYRLDENGFLLDFDQWDEAFATLMSSRLGISEGLSEKHWNVIRFIRRSFLQDGKCPLVYQTCHANGLTWAGLRNLFPTGYLRGACLMAGLNYRNRLINYYGEPGPSHQIEAAEARLAEKTYRVDVDGFLVDPSEWDEEYARRKAAEMKVPGGLSEDHWRIIRFLRESHETTGVVPTVYECCERNSVDLDDLEKLFPDGYHRGAVKLSGLRVR